MAKKRPSKRGAETKQQAAERMAVTGRPRARHAPRANVRTTATSVVAPRRKRD